MKILKKMILNLSKVRKMSRACHYSLAILACVVVFSTTYAMILPAITVDQDTAETDPAIELGEMAEDVHEEENVVQEDGGTDVVIETSKAQKETELEISTEDVTEHNDDADDAIGFEVTDVALETTETELASTYEINETDATETETELSETEMVPETKEEPSYIAAAGKQFYEGDDYQISVTYDESANLPEDVELLVKELYDGGSEEMQVAYDAYYKKSLEAVREKDGDDFDITFARYFDISIMYEGKKLEPEDFVDVKISYNKRTAPEVDEQTEVQVVHFENEAGKAKTLTEKKDDLNVATVDEKLDEVTFKTNGFSVYGIVGATTVTTQYITASGDTYEVTVACDGDTTFPKNARLMVTELSEEDTDYVSYIKQTADVLDTEISAFRYIKLLDISILDESGNKVSLNESVNVKIRLLDKEKSEDNSEFSKKSADRNEPYDTVTQVIHFGKSSEMLENKADGDTVSFKTDGFSIFAIVDISEFPENNLTQSFENEKYLITVSYGPEAEIPKEAKFMVSEVSPENDKERYENLKTRLKENINKSEITAHGSFAVSKETNILEMFKMGFWIFPDSSMDDDIANGTEIEPEDKVLVAITFKDETKFEEGGDLLVTHFSENSQEPEFIRVVLDKKNTTRFETDCFSDFVISEDGSTIKYVAPVSDYSNVHKEGDIDSFLSNLPYGTVHIDYSLMDMAKFTWNQTTGTSTQNSSVVCTADLVSGFTIGTDGNGATGIMYDNLSLDPGETVSHNGIVATIKFTNVATLSDGSKADVLVTISNTTVVNTDTRSRLADSCIFYGNGLMPAAGNVSGTQRLWGEFDFNIKVVANENTGDLSGKTFLYGMDDYDLECRNSIKDNYVLDVDASGNLIGKKINDGGQNNIYVNGYGRASIGAGSSTGFPDGGEREAIGRFFSCRITDEDEKIPLYSANGTTRLYFTSDPESADFKPVTTTKKTKWPAYALYKTAVYNIKTGEFRFYLLTLEPMVSESVTLNSGIVSEIYIPDTSCLYIDGYNMYPTRRDEETLNSGYFLVADANAGLSYTTRCSGKANSFLRSSNMFYLIISRTYQGGTISTSSKNVYGDETAYSVHQPEGATGDKPYKEALLAVPKNKTAVYTMTPDTFWHIWKVEISDDTEDNTSGEIDLRNVTWTDGSYTHHGKNGTDYTFTKDANGVITYTFTGVQENHYITVWWEKDTPQQTVTIIKKWEDENNARLSRPDDITAYLVRSDGGRVNPESDQEEKTILKTGSDNNIAGSTSWVKNDSMSQWEYTFAVTNLPKDVEFKAYEDPVEDYIGDAEGAENAKSSLETSYDHSTNTYQYAVTITNTRQSGGLLFTKQDQFEFPVEGAEFRLFNDVDCTQPPTADYSAVSDSDGKVSFSEVPCGTYYMKEVNVPVYGDDNTSFVDNRSQVYKVVIHEDINASAITPGTVSNHVFIPDDGGPVSPIINTKPEGQITIKKVVEGDDSSKQQSYDFIADFGLSMAGKTVYINEDSVTLDQNGKKAFSLNNGERITFSKLPDENPFTITEESDEGFITTTAIIPANGTFSIMDGNKVTGEIDKDVNYTVIFTNTQAPDITIRKTDSNREPNPLGGAKFNLYKLNDLNNYELMEGEFIIPAEGKCIRHLAPGIYKLEEIEAPDGYIITHKETTFSVNVNGPIIVLDNNQNWAAVTGDRGDIITIQNEAGAELPATGGIGLLPYTLGGLMLVICSVLMYGIKCIRERRKLC